MRIAVHINFIDLLDQRGCVASLTVSERRLAGFLTGVVAAATQDVKGPFAVLRCRRRPGRKPCSGFVVASFNAADDIYWFCPCCSDCGVITNWQGSFWDLTDMAHGRKVA